MPNTERQQIEEITTVDDDGEEYIVIVTDEFIERRQRDPDRPGTLISSWIAMGKLQFRLDDGTLVNRIDGDTFEIAHNRVRVKRVK